MLNSDTTTNGKLLFRDLSQCVDIHVGHQVVECVVPFIFMRAKSYFTLIRITVPAWKLSQGTVTNYSSNNQTKLTIVILGNIQSSFSNILQRFRRKGLAWPKNFIGNYQDFIALLQLRDRDPLILFATDDFQLVVGSTFEVATIGKINAIDALDAVVIHLFDGLETCWRANLHTYSQIARGHISMLGRNECIPSHARIHAPNILVIPRIRELIIAIHEDHARLRRLPGRGADQIPQIARAHGFLDLALPDQIPVGIVLDRLHKPVGDADRQVRVLNLARRAFDRDELLDIGMVVVEHEHQGTAPAV